jgi:methionyl aminopeptidase
MVFLKTDEEIDFMRVSNRLVGETLGEVARHIAPGVTTGSLNQIALDFIKSRNAKPIFLGFKAGTKGVPDFPGAICTSVNEQVVHGIPGDYVLKDGDIISVDCGVYLNGYCGDSAYTFCVGDSVSESVKKLLVTTKEALYEGIKAAVDGNRIGDIGNAVQSYCEKRGYSVVRDLVGHGIGHNMHEDPEVPNYGKRSTGYLLRKGMCIAIEPMINMGTKNVVTEKDGWTVRTKDRKCAAHYEHTIAIRHGEAEILSTFEYIEQVLGKQAI